MKTIAVGVGDCGVSKDLEDVLITYALGSCIALLIHDPEAQVAGLLHFKLPSSQDSTAAAERPLVYADTAIPLLFQNAYKLGANKKRMNVAAFGGAQIMDPENHFDIGKRNYLAMRKILWKAGVLVKREEVGGTQARTVKIEVSTGKIYLQHGDQRIEITDLSSAASVKPAITKPQEELNGL